MVNVALGGKHIEDKKAVNPCSTLSLIFFVLEMLCSSGYYFLLFLFLGKHDFWDTAPPPPGYFATTATIDLTAEVETIHQPVKTTSMLGTQI